MYLIRSRTYTTIKFNNQDKSRLTYNTTVYILLFVLSDERRKDDIPKIIAMQRQSQQRFLLFIYAFFLYTCIDGFSLSFVSFQSELRELRRTTRTTNEEELMLQHRHEHHRNSFTVLSISKDNYYDDFAGYGDNKEEDDDHDDDTDDDTDTDIDTGDGYIDTDSLGDWRNFRRSLSNIETPDNEDNLINNIDYRDEISKKKNEETLKKHDTKLAEEYATDSWAHVTSTVSSNTLHTYGVHFDYTCTAHIFFVLILFSY